MFFGRFNQLDTIILRFIFVKILFGSRDVGTDFSAVHKRVVNQAGVEIFGKSIYICTLEIDLVQLSQQFSDVSSVAVPSVVVIGGVPVSQDIRASGTSDQSVRM
ncbi:hypothetical protein BC833DRAFT_621745 [Globomyces pollinis-pini]|nr:hypothetical protein BC833DRAFT_621745 [Globomyces pollinis-pini]